MTTTTTAPDSIESSRVTPFLRWAGSKRRRLGTYRDSGATNFNRYSSPSPVHAAFLPSEASTTVLLADKNAR